MHVEEENVSQHKEVQGEVRLARETASWQNRLLAWGAVVGYCALIYFLSAQSNLNLPKVVPASDKWAHLIEYAVLGWLWTWAARSSWPESAPRTILLSALVFTLSYGVSDEWHQSHVPGRSASTADVGADMTGGGLGAGGFLFWTQTRMKKQR